MRRRVLPSDLIILTTVFVEQPWLRPVAAYDINIFNPKTEYYAGIEPRVGNSIPKNPADGRQSIS